MAAVLHLIATMPLIAEARPWRGQIPVAIALCEPSDPDTVEVPGKGPPPYPRPTADEFVRRLYTPGSWSLADFIARWSMGTASLGPARRADWVTLPLTRQEWIAQGRYGMFLTCQSATTERPDWPASLPDPGWQAPPRNPVWLVVGHPFIDLFGLPVWGGAFVPQDVDTGAAAHELGHALGLPHSFGAVILREPNMSGKVPRGPPGSPPIEYGDPWDVMSWGIQWAIPTGNGGGPAGISSVSLDWLGWLPTTRVVNHGADGRANASYCLASLDEPTSAGWLSVRIPLDVGRSPFFYLALEHRSRTGWGRGVRADIGDTVRVIRVSRDGHALRSTLLYDGPSPPPNQPWRPLTVYEEDGVRITTVRNQGSGGCSARVVVEDTRAHNVFARTWLASQIGPNRCKAGFVPRALDPFDHVCVTETARDIYLRSGSRWLGLGPEGSFPTRFGCESPRVSRGAFPGDDICVSPAERAAAALDNAAAGSRFELQ